MIVNSSTFKDAVEDILKDHYLPEVTEAAAEVVPKVAKEAAKRLKSSSPRRSGKYAKGWASKDEKGLYTVSATVYGKSGTYQLAHLLENGHALRGGGRVAGISHIKPVEEWAVEKAISEITKKLEGQP